MHKKRKVISEIIPAVKAKSGVVCRYIHQRKFAAKPPKNPNRANEAPNMIAIFN